MEIPLCGLKRDLQTDHTEIVNMQLTLIFEDIIISNLYCFFDVNSDDKLNFYTNRINYILKKLNKYMPFVKK